MERNAIEATTTSDIRCQKAAFFPAATFVVNTLLLASMGV